MAGSEESLDFTIKLAKNGEDFKSGAFESIDFKCEGGQVLKIGRHGKSDVAITAPGISWVHAEMRVRPNPEGEGKLQLVVRDVSSNGTGLQPPGKILERLPKGEDTPVADGAMVALPMRLKAESDQRFMTVHFADGAANDASPSGQGGTTEEPKEAAGAEVTPGEDPETARRQDVIRKRLAEKRGGGAIDLESDSPEAPPKQSDADRKRGDELLKAQARRRAQRQQEAVEGAVSSDARDAHAQDSKPAGETDLAGHLSYLKAAGERDTSADDAPKTAQGTKRSMVGAADEELEEKRPRKSSPMPDDAKGGLEFDLPPARPPSGPPGVRPTLPPRGARPKGAAGPPRAVASSDVPPILREKIQAGEGIIRDAREAEDRNQWGQAFDCYQRGLACFMEVLPQLGKDSPGGINLRQQINGYLTKAGELKDKLHKSKAFGCNKVARPRGPQKM